jgi:hypothetical protein
MMKLSRTTLSFPGLSLFHWAMSAGAWGAAGFAGAGEALIAIFLQGQQRFFL